MCGEGKGARLRDRRIAVWGPMNRLGRELPQAVSGSGVALQQFGSLG